MRRLFTVFIGLSALFIASCSAFFSVRGLGLLFVGSATMVMVMAASLEVGKLVAASFLYQYWNRIGIAVRAYLILAVGVLMGITSLGIYGYLARAYEKTNTSVALLEQQVDSVQREQTDLQARIDSAKGQQGKTSDARRQDIDKAQQQIAQANTSLEQSLARLEDRRKAAVTKRDAALEKLRQETPAANAALEQALARLEDRRKAVHAAHDQALAPLIQREKDQAKVLADGLASEDAAIAALNDRLAVLDRAVDAYTKEGGPGILKDDGIKKGAILRQQQKKERDAIAADMAQHRKAQDDLRRDNDAKAKEIDAQIAAAGAQADKDLAGLATEEKSLRQANADSLKSVDQRIAAAGDQYKTDSAGFDAEEKSLRDASAAAVAAGQQQIATLDARGQSQTSDGGNQIDAMYQQIRADNEQIQALRQEIAGTDVGSYRFVARALNAPVDTVVTWLMLVIVLVFDPLAVALTIGFNVALASEFRRRSGDSAATPAGAPALATSTPTAASLVGQPAAPGRHWPQIIGVASALVLTILVLGGGGYLVLGMVRDHARNAHAALVPNDSFAVIAFQPQVLLAAAQTPTNSATATGKPSAAVPAPAAGLLSSGVTNALTDLLSSGFDPTADVYAFAKYPAQRGPASAQRSDHPVMLLGLVARVTDPDAAEAGLSRCAQKLAAALRPPTASGEPLTRNRVMVRDGRGRYLDPEGGFLSFGLTDEAAVLMIEIEGDPNQPRIEQEMRLCLEQAGAGQASQATEGPSVSRTLPSGGALAVWFDAGRCFADMPKSAAAQARYQQLQRYLNFDLSLVIAPAGADRLNFIGQYAYAGERFAANPASAGNAPTAIELLAKLGSPEATGTPGRLMDRCADTLDFDSLIDRLREALSAAPGSGGATVVVEKSNTGARGGKFVLTARYDRQAGNPLLAAMRSLSLF